MDVRTPQPEQLLEPAGASSERAPLKFLYPTGSQPLEGYTIKRGIGRGGFGEVYFATSDAGKEVALKLIRRNLDVELRGVRHCLNLKHSNLIGVYDIRTDSLGDQWVVMEYVSGESLEDAIERHPNGMPVDEVIRWMRGIGAGVAYLHDHGIVHRDLKPGNVFLDIDSTDGGTVKLGDYGLSKFISCSRRSGQTESVGTVHYMAPEIANGRYGREIDTYALGIMLYEMLTGHVPFEGESVGEVLMKHLTAEPDLSSLDSPFREAVERTLAKDPEVRIGSVHELLELLPDGQGVEYVRLERIDGWSGEHAAADGIGAAHLFTDTSVRGHRGPKPFSKVPLERDVREPLYEWMNSTWTSWVEGWHTWDANPVGKALLLFVLVGLAVGTVTVWGSLAVLLGVVYVFYYAFWATLVRPAEVRRQKRVRRGPDGMAVARPAKRPPPAEQPVLQPMSRAEQRRTAAIRAQRLRTSWKEKVHERLRDKPLRQRATELLTSMVLSGILCAFLAMLAVVVVGGSTPGERLPLYLWLTGVTTVGTWVVLVTGKFTEGRFEDQIPMRLWQLVGGAFVGLVAWGLATTMMTGVPYMHDAGIGFHDSLLDELLNMSEGDYVQWQSQHLASPDALLSVMYFSLMMVGLRWWRLAEYARRTRLSLVGVGLAICGAWLAHLVCWYPQPTGMAVAGIIAVATQLVSPWLPPSGRKSAAEEAMAG
ncbi:protein kinase [Aeoliella sp. ICT_H6.2]|uniref:Protein kinase n=1 Tax=Aeoliella straminimaris TaxID=2954799 RepID=A0A9X2JHT5_9BACT|nr:serine/threonine-protein kinase [Aeoliella straminimaris]MCO6044968.1 protein kinase [Aeoliella straminimaris]